MDLFIDESGNSGNITKYEQMIASERFYTLSYVALDKEDVITIQNEINRQLEKINFKLSELKFKNIKHYPEVIHLIQSILLDYNIDFHIEAMEKKYLLAMNIDQYLINPYYCSNNPSKATADEINKSLNENDATKIFDFFKSNTIEEYIANSINIKEIFNRTCDGKYRSTVMENIDYSIELLHNNMGLSKFIPLPDFDNKGNYLSCYHHIYCLSNCILIAKEKYNDISVIHDELNMYDRYVQEEIKNNHNVDICFRNSKDNIGIQIADILSGMIRNILEEIIVQNKTPKYNIYINQNINWVMSYETLNLLEQKSV